MVDLCTGECIASRRIVHKSQALVGFARPQVQVIAEWCGTVRALFNTRLAVFDINYHKYTASANYVYSFRGCLPQANVDISK